MTTRPAGCPRAPPAAARPSPTRWRMPPARQSRARVLQPTLSPFLCRKLPNLRYYRPKEKVGENPPDNASEDPSKLGIIRSGSSGSKRGSIKFRGSTNSIGEHQKKEPGADTPGLSSGLRLRSVFLEQFL